ncbi:MAG: type II secretion system protein [Oscillospiraceae bacterium]|nr:type II secretion system protein [Oscillospiraceae bacterium]
MKQKNNEGFSLIEILVGMAILALIVLPTCTGMVMSIRLNAKTNQMLQAQLAVSSAVETLMAEGIKADNTDIPGVAVKLEEVAGSDGAYVKVTVISANEDGSPNDLVSVETHIRRVLSENNGTEGGT